MVEQGLIKLQIGIKKPVQSSPGLHLQVKIKKGGTWYHPYNPDLQ